MTQTAPDNETRPVTDWICENPAQTAVFFDIDDTLLEIADSDFLAATVPDDALGQMRSLRDHLGLVGIVTGRSHETARDALHAFAGDFPLATGHGTRIVWPDGAEWVDDVAVGIRDQLDVATTMARTVGWQFADKEHSLVLKFRHMGDMQTSAVQMKSQIATVLDPRRVQVDENKFSLEIKAKGAATKGDAVLRMLDAAPGDITRVAFLGDDYTDIDAFTALRNADGYETLSVAVTGIVDRPDVEEAADTVLSGVTAVHAVVADAAMQLGQNGH